LRGKINRRISLFTFIAFLTVVIFAGVSKTTNAETVNADTSTVESNYNLGMNNAGEIVVLATETSETTTGASIGLVISDVSDEEPVLIGTVVNLSQTTTGGAIIYTTDGTEPEIETALIYKDAIMIGDDVTIKACVYMDSVYGEVAQFNYKVIKVDEVQVNIPEGIVELGTEIELFTNTTGAAIYYEIEELDFNDTTTPQSIKYDGPITIDSSKRITAYAKLEGYKNSIKSEFTYEISNQIIIQRENDDEVYVGEFAEFEMKVKNRLDEQKSVSLIIAVYDEKDRMIDYIYVSDVLKPGEATEIEGGLRVSEAGSYIKSYIIDSLEGLIPVSNTLKIPVKSK